MGQHNYQRMSGFGDLPGNRPHPGSPDYDGIRDERIAELADQFKADDAKRAEAEERTAGTFEPEHYSELTLALHDLHYTHPDDLIGSGVLTRLYQLAKVEAVALDDKLMEMAEESVEESERVARASCDGIIRGNLDLESLHGSLGRVA